MSTYIIIHERTKTLDTIGHQVDKGIPLPGRMFHLGTLLDDLQNLNVAIVFAEILHPRDGIASKFNLQTLDTFNQLVRMDLT